MNSLIAARRVRRKVIEKRKRRKTKVAHTIVLIRDIEIRKSTRGIGEISSLQFLGNENMTEAPSTMKIKCLWTQRCTSHLISLTSRILKR